MQRIGIEEGRRAFGADAANYDNARPGYPARVFEVLRERCGPLAGCNAFEIGAGTGLATRSLLALGLAPLVAIEPDERAAFAAAGPDPARASSSRQPEDAELPPTPLISALRRRRFIGSISAALTKVVALLISGGWWACWWNVFGDHERDDAFHKRRANCSRVTAARPGRRSYGHAAPNASRIWNPSARSKTFPVEILKWTLVLNPAEVRVAPPIRSSRRRPKPSAIAFPTGSRKS
jgi:hypothetical protein